MKLYSQDDLVNSRKAVKASVLRMLLIGLPFLAAAAAGFIVRNQLLCTAGCILFGSVLILLYDTKIMPAMRYRNHLEEIHSGLTRQTVGALVRIGTDPVHDIGLNFTEIILNIYEDMDEEGERRFLLDAKKEVPAEWLNRDVVVRSHGSFLLDIELVNAAPENVR